MKRVDRTTDVNQTRRKYDLKNNLVKLWPLNYQVLKHLFPSADEHSAVQCSNG